MNKKFILFIALLVLVESSILTSASKSGIFNKNRVSGSDTKSIMDTYNPEEKTVVNAEYSKEQYMEKSKAAYYAGDYVEAIGIIREAKSYYANDRDIERYEKMYASAEPKTLSSLHIMSDHCCNKNDYVRKDRFGNEYYNALSISTMNVYEGPNRAYVTLALNGDYTNLSMDSFNWSNSDSSEIVLRIIADDVCIFESEKIKPMDGAQNINIDVSNVKVLEICAYHIKGTGGGLAVLGNGCVYKKLTEEDF